MRRPLRAHHLSRKVLPSNEVETKTKSLAGKNPKEARQSADLSLTRESHLDEKVRSAETVDCE
jgi:hypothetical protein